MKRALLLPILVGLVVAGCGGGGGYGGSSSSSKPASGSTSDVVAIHKSGLGPILVDSRGRTLYLFEKDKSTRSECSGACASAWPPVTSPGAAKGGAGIATSKLGTSSRGNGAMQVTYGGHPLYTYAGDSSPGQTNGEGLNQFGAEWYVLSPSGTKVETGGS